MLAAGSGLRGCAVKGTSAISGILLAAITVSLCPVSVCKHVGERTMYTRLEFDFLCFEIHLNKTMQLLLHEWRENKHCTQKLSLLLE